MKSSNRIESNEENKLSSSDLALIEELNYKGGAFIIPNSSLPLPIIIWIDPDRLTKADLPYINKIFSNFLANKKQNTSSQIKVAIGNNRIFGFLDIKPVLLDQTYFNADQLSADSLYSFITTNQKFALNSILFTGVLSILKKLEMPINVSEWSDILYNEIKKNNEHTLPSFNKINFIENLNYISELDKNSVCVELIFPELLIHLIQKNEIKKLGYLNNFYPDYFQLIKKTNGHPYFYIHEAIKVNNDNFHIILNMIDAAEPYAQPYDNDGNSLLHVSNLTHLKKALELTPDINHRNHTGNTALHLAASEGNLEKIRFLLLHGADPEIKNEKGETFWTITSGNLDNLRLYQLYKQYGNVLKLPPDIVEQKGLNCAFYAVACAADYLRALQPGLFKEPALPPRKRDVNPKASSSLRQLRENLNIPGKGAIFSVTELQKVIEKTECKGIVLEITSLDQFMDIIKKTIEQNLPIIIPFSSAEGDNQGKPNPSPTGSTAHWATIIGWASNTETKGILLAQYGKYFDTKADELFKAFYEIDSSFPGCTLFKKKGQDWVISKNAIESSVDTKIHTIPLTSLEDFRRKLVIVLPPGYNEELLKLNNNASINTKNAI